MKKVSEINKSVKPKDKVNKKKTKNDKNKEGKIKTTRIISKEARNKIKNNKVAFSIFASLSILAIVGLIILIKNIVITKKYAYYTERMEWYGYDKLYDNEEATSTDSVMSDEIAKMVAAVLYNETDTSFAESKLSGVEEESLSINESWLEFAKSIPLVYAKDITFGTKMSKLQVAELIVDGIEKVYRKDIEVTEQLKEKYRKKYTEDELEIIDKGISIGILENSKSDINKKVKIKGELNKMLIIASEKYSMVYYNNTYSLKNNATVVTDKEQLPSNADKYPYVIDSISKEIYEIEMPEMLSEISESPKTVYDTYHDEYYYTEKNIAGYFDAILNVDYNTITKEDFEEKIKTYVVYRLDEVFIDSQPYLEDIEEYVNYVKENHIVLKGKATPLLPIIYSNGSLHFLRCKIEFEVVNSDTNKNLLFWDTDTTYNSNTISVYADITVSPTLVSKAFKIYNGVRTMEFVALDLNNSVVVE